MPICTSCTHPTPYLYTAYQSAYNLRLEQCAACHAFADPYVEHDTLTLLLDLILLKRDVYRHLLFNRGLGARKVGQNESGEATDLPDQGTIGEWSREKSRWWLIAKLGIVLIAIDAFIRWTHLRSDTLDDHTNGAVGHWTRHTVVGFLRIFIGCLIETVAFHAGIMFACYVVLRFLAWVRLHIKIRDRRMSGIRQQFRLSHVPLTLLYSSLTKLFLLFLLSIWQPAPNDHSKRNHSPMSHPIIENGLRILDEDRLDREWVVRNVLGGMAAGFGLRVVLDCHPLFTTTIILAGWAVKTLIAGIVGERIGFDFSRAAHNPAEMWLAYSIP